MQRRKFIQMTGAAIVIAGTGFYLLSDKSNFVRNRINSTSGGNIHFKPDEKEMLYLASLAPSGHNTQPWLVKYMAPYHWVICNDKTKWLPGVDPTQRETILSIGAFLQNLDYAAGHFGYSCHYKLLASTSKDEAIMDVQLVKSYAATSFDIEQIKLRRTVRSNYLNDVLTAADIAYLTGEAAEAFHFIPNTATAYRWLNEQTIEANRIQVYHDAAQTELADWIRFSSADAASHCDGLTTASMEIGGIPAWVLRNFYTKKAVMKKDFREQTIDKVRQQVEQSAGWLLMTSQDNSVAALLDTGKRLQRLLLKTRQRNIAIHPMTQVLEEPTIAATVQQSTGITDPVQFVLRTGYIKKYPDPVSLRRPVDWFVRS